MLWEINDRLYSEARRLIAGGASSPSRSFKAVGGGTPPVIVRGEGSYMWDADGNRYIDYLAAYGPIILGHAHPEVAAAISRQAALGTLYGTPCAVEIQMARRLQEALPSLELLRFTNSGTEAVMSAVRVARAHTGRHKVVKFEGCYHGHSDIALVKAGSGPATLGIAESAGVPPHVAADVISVPYNDLQSLRETLERWGTGVAAVLVEPIAGNFGIVAPEPGFLQGVQDLAAQAGALVIYDEVISAFRFCYGGAQTLHGTQPDLTCLGKIIGGGTPIGAYGGRAAVMEQVAPLGPAYQAGTLAGNPLSMAAGMACLDVLRRPETYEGLEVLTGRLAAGLLELARRHGVPVTVNRLGSGFTVFFTDRTVRNYDDACQSDPTQFARFFQAMLAGGVHLAPSRFEAWFVTLAHSEDDVTATLAVADRAFAGLATG